MSYSMGLRGPSGRGMGAGQNVPKRDQTILAQLEQAFGLQCTLDQLGTPEMARQLLEVILNRLHGVQADDMAAIVATADSPTTLPNADYFTTQLQDIAIIRAARWLLQEIGNSDEALTVQELYKPNPERIKRLIYTTTRFALRTGKWIDLRRDKESALDKLRQECETNRIHEEQLQLAKANVLRSQEDERQNASQMREVIQKIQREQVGVLQRKQNLDGEMATFNSDELSVKDGMKMVAKEIGILRETIANNQRFIIDDPQSMRDSMKKLHEQVDKVRSDLVTLNQRRTMVQQQIDAYNEFIRDMDKLVQRMNDSIREKDQLTKVDMEYNAADTRLSVILDKITTAQKENEDLEENLARSRDIAERSRQLHDQQLKDLEMKKNEKAAALTKESDECQSKAKRVQTLMNEFESLAGQVQSIHEHYNTLLDLIHAKLDSSQAELLDRMDSIEEAMIRGSESGGLFSPMVAEVSSSSQNGGTQ